MLVVDKDIILRINKGDLKAFEEFYSICYVYLCVVALKYLHNLDTAKEIVNDVFVNIWDHRASLVYPANKYLIKSVQNACLNHLRRKRLDEISLTDVQESMIQIEEQFIKSDSHPLSLLEDKEFREEIINALNALPLKCRDIFIQHIYHNKTYEEIAQTNNISSSTVRVQFKIGLSKLKETLRHLAFSVILFFI